MRKDDRIVSVQSPAPDNPKEGRQTIAMQPVPTEYQVTTLAFPGGFVASDLTRVWNIGDTMTCRLCPLCVAIHSRGVCVVHVDQLIEDDPSALLFSTRGLTEVGFVNGRHSDPRANRPKVVAGR